MEPWNTWSNIVFLLVILYWAYQFQFRWREHTSVFLMLAFTGIGLVGGTLYHGTRSHCFWLFLDWIPIVLNSAVLSMIFWHGYFEKWKISFCCGFIPALLAFLLQVSFGFQSIVFSSLAYLLLFLSVLLSLVFWIQKKGTQHINALVFASGSIAMGFLSRLAERLPQFDFLPMGTHFLWHIFGALSCHFVLSYLYRWQLQKSH